MFVTTDIIDFEKHFQGDDMFCDSLTAAKIVLSIHYQIDVLPGKEDELSLIDTIFSKLRTVLHIDESRHELCEVAKLMIKKRRLSYVDALQLLFTRAEMECFGY